VLTDFPTRGLVIRQPWLDHFMAGHKRWEIRSRPCRLRGRVALIEAGQGHIVALATLAQCKGPLLPKDWDHAKAAGHVVGPEADVLGYAQAYAWVLNDIKPLDLPVSYVHPRGAIIWVKLSQEVQKTLSGVC
jgi:hypothetical protein